MQKLPKYLSPSAFVVRLFGEDIHFQLFFRIEFGYRFNPL